MSGPLFPPVRRRAFVELVGRVDDLDANVAAVASGLVSPIDLADPAAVVADAATTNRADPDVNDPALPTLAAQLHRVYNTGTGALSAQSPATLGAFGVTKKYDVTAGTEYTISMHGAPLGFVFYFTGSPFIGFYNTDGSFHSQITAGFTRSSGDRVVTFTVPAGAEKVAFTVRNPTDFSNTDPLTEAALQACLDAIMLNVGAVALGFEPYSTGAYVASADLFAASATGQTTVAIQGEYAFIRAACQQSADKDVVWRMRVFHELNYNAINSRTGTVDCYGIRFIDRATPAAYTVAAFNQSTDIHEAGIDEATPEKLNSLYLGGGHGVTSYKVTQAGHGKAAADVGSIWTDGVDQWVLTYITSSSVLEFVRRYTGTATKWRFSSAAPTGATFTHVSGATNTAAVNFTGPTQAQFVPVIRDHIKQLTLDGVALTAPGVYVGDRAVIQELYSILNPASQQDALIAAVGGTPDYTAAGIAEQVRVFSEFSWNAWGALSVRCGRGIKQEFDRDAGAPGDYWGAIQLQRLTLAGDSTPGPHASVWLYVPDVSPVAGYDFQAVADVTANAAFVQVLATDCDDPADPASHFAMLGKNGGGAVISGQLYGYDRAVGLGVPATRAASAANVLMLSTAEKQYPVAIDHQAGDGAAGQVLTVAAFRAPFKPTDAQLTVPGVIVTSGNATYCYITAHTDIAGHAVAVPSEFNGQAVTIVKDHANVTVHDDYVADGAVRVSVTGGYGDIVLRFGA